MNEYSAFRLKKLHKKTMFQGMKLLQQLSMGIVGIKMERRTSLNTFKSKTDWDVNMNAKIQKNASHMLSTETT